MFLFKMNICTMPFVSFPFHSSYKGWGEELIFLLILKTHLMTIVIGYFSYQDIEDMQGLKYIIGNIFHNTVV